MWDKMSLAVKALNRATIGLDDRLIMVSQAAKESLPPSLQRRATVVIHGIEMEPVQQALAQPRGSLAARYAKSSGWPTVISSL